MKLGKTDTEGVHCAEPGALHRTTGMDTIRWLGGTHQGLKFPFLGATDTGEDVLVLTLRYSLCPSGSLALGRMLAIQFKFKHMLGVSATAGTTLG